MVDEEEIEEQEEKISEPLLPEWRLLSLLQLLRRNKKIDHTKRTDRAYAETSLTEVG